QRSHLVGPVYSAAAAAPAVADGRAWSPASSHDELQILRVFDGWNKALIVVGVHLDRKPQSPLAAPNATPFEVTYLAASHLTQTSMHLGPAEPRLGTDDGMLRPHGHDHVRAGVHIP